MNRLLEQYLSEVAAQLQELPVARRNEELREMRQHLQNVVIINQETGQSEDQAGQAAVKQFGPSEEIAENIVLAWLREDQLKNRRNYRRWAVVIITAGLISLNISPEGSRGTIIFCIPLMLIMLGQRYWLPKYKTAAGAYKTRPLGLVPCLLVTAFAPVCSFINGWHWHWQPFYGSQPLLGTIILLIMSTNVWIVRYGALAGLQKTALATGEKR